MAFWSLTLSILKLQPDSVKAVRMGTIPIPGIGHQHQPPGTPPLKPTRCCPSLIPPFLLSITEEFSKTAASPECRMMGTTNPPWRFPDLVAIFGKTIAIE